MVRGSGKRSSSAGSEKMEKVCDRQKKMEGHCSTGQRSQRAVVPVEGEEEEYTAYLYFNTVYIHFYIIYLFLRQ
jgi:hypothetical protein